MKIAFLITTYNRPKSFLKLIKSIKNHGDIYVVNDGSDLKYKYLKGIEVIEKEHGGKPGYYYTLTVLFNMIRGKKYDYYFVLPDDMIPVNGFLEKAINTYRNIEDNKKIALNLFVEKSRYMKPCWTDFQPVMMEHAILTNWVDLCFLCEEDFFKCLDYEVGRINRNWEANPELGSGAGAHISRKLFSLGRTLYQNKYTLFLPQPESFESKLNPQRKNDLLHECILY